MKSRLILLLIVLVACAVVAGVLPRTPRTGNSAGLADEVTALRLQRGTRPSSLPTSINVVGQVVDHGGGSTGIVTVRVGSSVSQTVGAITPQFQATVPGTRASDMVSIEVEGQGFKYVSMLGSYGRLAAAAGADATLTVDESDAVRVSPMSTALQFFVARQLGSQPVSDAQLERGMRAVQSYDLQAAALVMFWHARGELTIPGGYAHAYALLQDAPAYEGFFDPVVQNRVAGGSDDLAAMAFTPFSSADLGEATAVLGPVVDLDAPMLAPDVQVIERVLGGYRVHAAAFSRRNASFDGELDDRGALSLVPVNDISTWTSRSLCSTGSQIVERSQLVGQTHRLQRRAAGTSLWLVTEEHEISYPNCADLQARVVRYAYFRIAVDLKPAFPRPDERHFLGRRALPRFCLEEVSWPTLANYLRACGYVEHEFARGGGGQMREMGDKVDASMLPAVDQAAAAFSWRFRAPGLMEVASEGVVARYWLVDRGAGAPGLVYVAEAQDGGDVLSLAGYVAMLNGNAARGFESMSPVGTWRYATFEQAAPPPYSGPGIEYTDRFLRRSDGTAVQFVTRTPGTPYTVLSSWRVFDGRLYDTRVSSDSADPAHDCQEALAGGATQCAPLRVRYFRPYRRTGDRLYGIEEIYTNLTLLNGGLGGFDPPFEYARVSRPTYHELD